MLTSVTSLFRNLGFYRVVTDVADLFFLLEFQRLERGWKEEGEV
jgi:hypothetical protein